MKIVVAAAVILLLYISQRYVFEKHWKKNLDVTFHFSHPFAGCGEKAELVEQISNGKRMPLPLLHFRFSADRSLKFDDRQNAAVTDQYHKSEIFSLPGRTRITRRLSFTATKRGIYRISGATVSVRDFFLTRTYAEAVTSEAEIYVLPEKLNRREDILFLRGMEGEVETRRSLLPDETLPVGVREYMTSDSYHSINWKQTARAGCLMVNLFGHTMREEVRILLNLDTDVMVEQQALLEKTISLVSSLAADFLNRGIMVSLLSNGLDREQQKIQPVSPGAETAHSLTIDRALTEICGSGGKDAFLKTLTREAEVLRSDVIYLLISPYHKEDLLCITDRMVRQGAALQMIVPFYDAFPSTGGRPYVRMWEVSMNG